MVKRLCSAGMSGEAVMSESWETRFGMLLCRHASVQALEQLLWGISAPRTHLESWSKQVLSHRGRTSPVEPATKQSHQAASSQLCPPKLANTVISSRWHRGYDVMWLDMAEIDDLSCLTAVRGSGTFLTPEISILEGGFGAQRNPRYVRANYNQVVSICIYRFADVAP